MKKIMMSALVLALTIGAAQAQNTTPEKGNGHRKEHRKQGYEQLDLTADQKAKLQALRENFKKQSDELKNNNQLSAEQKQARRKELHQQFRTQAEAILTPAQRGELAQKKAEWNKEGRNGNRKNDDKGRKGVMGERRAGGGFEGRADLTKELNLTQAQQAKVHQIHSDFKSKMETVRNDNTLTQEQKRAKMQELMKARQEQMRAVLTQEQREKMDALRKERAAKNI